MKLVEELLLLEAGVEMLDPDGDLVRLRQVDQHFYGSASKSRCHVPQASRWEIFVFLLLVARL